jgi:hypothetical protein
MREVSVEEYLDFVSKHKAIIIEDQMIPLDPIEVKRLEPLPEELTDVSTTVWSFPGRGSGPLIKATIVATGLHRYLAR